MIAARALVVCVLLAGCSIDRNNSRFDRFDRVIEVGNWMYALNVENQNEQAGRKTGAPADKYLKATLYISNSKTKHSLLYSASRDNADYEEKYKYLSFGSREDLCLKWKDQTIYPIGYVFEPSNGLGSNDKLVYKFRLSDDLYRKLKDDDGNVAYWYTDKLVGIGKICFKQQ